MSERLGVNVWERGLGEGWSIKDAFDQNRPNFESLGLTWTFNQVGTPRVRIAGQLVPPMYVGYRLQERINSGPVEYIELYNAMWPTFTTAGSQVRCLSLLSFSLLLIALLLNLECKANSQKKKGLKPESRMDGATCVELDKCTTWTLGQTSCSSVLLPFRTS